MGARWLVVVASCSLVSSLTVARDPASSLSSGASAARRGSAPRRRAWAAPGSAGSTWPSHGGEATLLSALPRGKGLGAEASNSGNAATNTPRGGAAQQSSAARGRLLLVFVSFLFGTLNVALRKVYDLPGAPQASALSFARGALAAVCFLPAMLVPQPASAPAQGDAGPSRRRFLTVAFELAFWNFCSQALVNVGLMYTDAARASFFLQLSVVITPLISLCCGARVKSHVWTGCAAALTGLLVLSFGGDAGGAAAASGSLLKTVLSSLHLSGGDLLCLGGAVSWSFLIFRLGRIAGSFPEVPLQGTKTAFLALLYGSWFATSATMAYSTGGSAAVAALWPGWRSTTAWLLLFYTAIGPGAIADVLQQVGQSAVSAAEANVILCAEPVFTAICSRIFLGEVTTPKDKLGGGLILLAALIASGTFSSKKDREEADE